MKNGFLQKKIIAFLLSLILMINLILIPKIDVQAATFPATTSFTYTYDGYDYQFYFSGLVDSPQNYRFDSSALDYLLQKSAEGINISVSSGIGAKISNIFSNGFTAIFNFYRNFVIATDKLVADWIVFDDIYGFEFQFTGVDSSYPGYETYGDAYGWRFIGWLGEKIDLVLDSQGMLYGSNPIGNYTFSDDQLDLGRWSIHQYESQGGEFWSPSVYTSSFSDLKEPYIEGTALHWFYYLDGVEHSVVVSDFRDTTISFISVETGSYKRVFPSFFNTHGISDIYIDDVLTNHKSPADYIIVDNQNYSGQIHGMNQVYIPSLGGSQTINFGFSLPGYIYSSRYVYDYNYVGWYNSLPVSGSQNIYLKTLTTTPLPDPIVLPVDDPIPVIDIEPDPIDFDPDPDTDPDPIPGIDYPVPGPTPFPVPPIPPLVSGNDILWPDLNYTFDIEDNLIGLANPLINFQWPSFSSIISSFLDSIVWVSSIMTALFNGSDYNILFSVLSVFFIAASIFGLYKWWHR